MTLMMKSILITIGLGLLLIVYEWNLMRKKKEGITSVDWKNLRDLVFLTAGACALVAFVVATVF